MQLEKEEDVYNNCSNDNDSILPMGKYISQFWVAWVLIHMHACYTLIPR